ncbi:MAG: glycosyltransferase family 2 protein [Puniceicoccales bacterium]|jgi:glycosyltransferase involved in cell wall biosynthesis|nr:glycosyltransferase family 2 protein [Puniceicoccales bacterium]
MNVNLSGLSVVIIAKNAEKTIARGLQSVAPIANQIIVVINDCADDTRNIAELYGAQVVEHKWDGFRQQKNFAISLAKYDWVLSIDSDEALSEELQMNIRNFIAIPDNPHVAVKFARKTLFINKWILHGNWYPDYNVRLFRNGSGSFVGHSVHERLQVKGKIYRLPGDILHYSCESLVDFMRRNITYADMSAMDLLKSGKKTSFFFAVLRSQWKFFYCFILKFGFLDGATGYYLAKTQSFLTLYKYFRLYNLIESNSLP